MLSVCGGEAGRVSGLVRWGWAYIDAKSEVILDLLQLAEVWAQETAWKR
jgi:hypothetical protein